MSMTSAIEEINRFLGSETPEVLCISGRWGVGKTYAWKECLRVLENNSGHKGLRRHSYVSLFGLNTIDDLKLSIFENRKAILASRDPNSLCNVWRRRLHDFCRCWGRRAKAILSWGFTHLPLQVQKITFCFTEQIGNALRGSAEFRNDVSSLGLPIAYLKASRPVLCRIISFYITEYIICLDDFERKGALKTKEILGLISFLKEHKNCKVVLLLNQDAIEKSEKSDFESYLEKAVDVKINFVPSPDEAFRSSGIEQSECNQSIKEKCLKLGITNIRVLRKIRYTVDQVAPLLTNYHSGVLEKAIHSIVLLGWCYFDKDVAPSINVLQSKNFYKSLLSDNKTLSADEAATNALLDSYGFDMMDDFDRAILDGISNGYFDKLKISESAQKIQIEIKESMSNQAISSAWDAFRSSFDNNEVEVLNGLYQHTKSNIGVVSGGTLNATVKILREFEKDSEATQLIATYKDHLSKNSALFEQKRSLYIYDVDDPELRQAILELERNLSVAADSLFELLKRLASIGNPNSKELQAVSEYAVQEFVDAFSQAKGKTLQDVLAMCLTAHTISSEIGSIIRNKSIEALKILGGTSKINKMRVKRYLGNLETDGTSAN